MKNVRLQTVLIVFVVYLFSVGMPNQVFAARVTPPKCPADKTKLVVAPSKGDYTMITAALNNSTPTPSSPCTIEVWPGTYVENVVMKSYVHLMGSGRDVTIIQPTENSGDVINVPNLTNVTISGFSLRGVWSGVNITGSSSVTIRDNAITGTASGTKQDGGVAVSDSSSITIRENGITGDSTAGVYLFNSSSVTICENTINNNGGTAVIDIQDSNSIVVCQNLVNNPGSDGVASFGGSFPVTISGNTINGGGLPGSKGINFYNSSGGTITINGNIVLDQPAGGIVGGGAGGSVGKIIENIVTNSGGGYEGITINTDSGIVSGNHVSGSANDGIWLGNHDYTVIGNTVTGNAGAGISANGSGDMIIHNRVTSNGTDIIVRVGVTPHVSFNVFDTFTGACVGKFNVKSDGTAWPDGASCP